MQALGPMTDEGSETAFKNQYIIVIARPHADRTGSNMALVSTERRPPTCEGQERRCLRRGAAYTGGGTGRKLEIEDSCESKRPHVSVADCRSLADHLNSDAPARVQDKRLQIELIALRQSIFTEDGNRTCEVYHGGGDRVDWIGTATQAADCFTKSMKPDFILRLIGSGVWAKL